MQFEDQIYIINYKRQFSLLTCDDICMSLCSLSCTISGSSGGYVYKVGCHNIIIYSCTDSTLCKVLKNWLMCNCISNWLCKYIHLLSAGYNYKEWCHDTCVSWHCDNLLYIPTSAPIICWQGSKLTVYSPCIFSLLKLPSLFVSCLF